MAILLVGPLQDVCFPAHPSPLPPSPPPPSLPPSLPPPLLSLPESPPSLPSAARVVMLAKL